MNRKVFNYKGVKVNIFGIPIKEQPKNRRIKESERSRSIYNTSFSSNLEISSPKNLIVIYDIPHNKKKERDWFRRHLKKFDYIMIQKSVWVGPSPLPNDFLDYVKSIDLKDNFKTFKLAHPYSENNNEIK
jgi:DNA-binding transcriptional regulator PaaX